VTTTPQDYHEPIDLSGSGPPHDGLPPNEQWAAFARLALVLVAAAVVAIVTGVGETVAIVVALLFMIVLHEFGHFIMAKWADMKVTEFFVGFGTRLWSFRRGETEYGIKAFPLGGYVKIIGMNNLEEVAPEDEPRSLRQKPYWRKLSVLVAGSAMHFIIALVLLYTLFAAVGVPGPPSLTIGTISGLTSGPSPAQQAGFQVGDRILSVDGQTFKSFDDLAAYIKTKPGQTLDFAVNRQGQVLHLRPTPVDLSKVQVTGVGGSGLAADTPTGFVGIGPTFPSIRSGPIESFSKAGGLFVDLSARTFDALGGLVTANGVSSYGHMLVNKKAADSPTATTRFTSPVGIVRYANQAAQHGLSDVFFLLILINIFVGIFNLLPLLPLDGGHIAIATYERVRSRKDRPYHADVMKLMPLTYGVVLLLGFIFVTSLFMDIRSLVG
jgi:membrane-associated protease RseP (regulator of RpoE activity)